MFFNTTLFVVNTTLFVGNTALFVVNIALFVVNIALFVVNTTLHCGLNDMVKRKYILIVIFQIGFIGFISLQFKYFECEQNFWFSY